nr:immunoglobulin light chain junction region [Macaca mulatta]
CQRYNDLVFTF